jgi:Phosphotyrosine interaction domain (PTB/PID)
MEDDCCCLSVTELGSTLAMETKCIGDLDGPVNLLLRASEAQRRNCWLAIHSKGIYLKADGSKRSKICKIQKLQFCSPVRAKPEGEPLFVFVVRHKKTFQCHAFLCESDAEAKKLADFCSAQMVEQRPQSSTQEAPRRRLDVREDECANSTPKGFVLIEAILGLLTACFAK